jgi:hypothetical protein
MGIFDTGHLEAHARELLALAREAHEKGQIGFAQQLRAQARKYLGECAAMGTDCEDKANSDEGSFERPSGR